MEETSGTSALLAQIKKQAMKTTEFVVSNPVLGNIESNMQLKLDNFDHPLPRSAYLAISLENPLKQGDRVLCVPVDSGGTIVVVGRVE